MKLIGIEKEGIGKGKRKDYKNRWENKGMKRKWRRKKKIT